MEQPTQILTNAAMRRRLSLFVVVFGLGFFVPPPAAAQGVAISDTNITVGGADVLTMGDAAPLYIRGTGLSDPANRLVKLGDTILVNDANRGLTLTILDARSHADLGSTNYDIWQSGAFSDILAIALGTMNDGQIGILTSFDAFEPFITPALRAQARRLGLFQLAGLPASTTDATTWRQPYAAIFRGSGGASRQAMEILQPNIAEAPYAVIATWLIGDGFVGQAVTPADYLRCSGVPGLPGPRYTDCGDGTVVDNHTGLFWLKDASCDALGPNGDGTADWNGARAAAAALADGTCGLSDGSAAGDWRLPTVKEFCRNWEGAAVLCSLSAKADSLIDARFSFPALSNATGDAQWSEGDAFVGVVWSSPFYWSSTTVSYNPNDAWNVSLGIGGVDSFGKVASRRVWPVRGGQ